MNNQVLERAANIEENRVDVFSRLISNRIVFIDNLLEDQVVIDTIAVLLLLEKDKQEKITITINAEVGDIRNVFALYDVMQSLKSPIETLCIGSAMREAVLLLAAGSKGQRLISRNADISICQLTGQGTSISDMTDTQIFHQRVMRNNETFLKELSKLTGKSLKQIKRDTERQLFMTPKEAIAYGIADGIA